MATRKLLNQQKLLRERLRSVSIDLESDVEYLASLQATALGSAGVVQSPWSSRGLLGADAEHAPVTPSPRHLAEKLQQSTQEAISD